MCKKSVFVMDRQPGVGKFKLAHGRVADACARVESVQLATALFIASKLYKAYAPQTKILES
jgi:hypothetical protein